MSMTYKKTNEQLMDAIGTVDEQYILEYIKVRDRMQSSGMTGQFRHPGKLKLTFALAAAMIMLLGTLSVAASAIGHFLTNNANEQKAILKNYNELEAAYVLPIGGTQECGGVKGTLNGILLEDHHLLLSYTFDWHELEDAQDGSFHTWFLPWFFYIEGDGKVICQSEYTGELHTQIYPADTEDDFSGTFLYCIDLGDIDGKSLVGKELTVRLLYAKDGEGFVNSFTPETCFADREWHIGKTYEFEGNEITLNSVRESALYVTLFIDCDAIGRAEDEYMFILSDDLGNDYSVYSYEDEDTNGYWFTKPDTVGTQLTLKIVHSQLTSDSYGNITDDSYEVLCEIPIELKTSIWDRFR